MAAEWAALADWGDAGERRDAIGAHLTSLAELAPADLDDGVRSFLATEEVVIGEAETSAGAH